MITLEHVAVFGLGLCCGGSLLGAVLLKMLFDFGRAIGR